MKWFFRFLIFSTSIHCMYSQDTIRQTLTVNDVFTLAEQHSKKLAISKEGITLSKQKTAISKSARLPEISASVSAGYISNAVVLEPNFSYAESIGIPHFLNNYDVEANQILYNGNIINNKIDKARLEETLSELNYDKDREEIKIALLGRYLDLYALYNQQKVYKTNIALANTRLKNITDLNREGMVTKNDIIRSQLQIADLSLLLDKINNNISIANKELCVVLGLDERTIIATDPGLLLGKTDEDTYEGYLSIAYRQTPMMRATTVHEEIAEKNIKIAKGSKLPKLSLFATDGMVRPYIYIIPPLNNYVNLYQTGIKLTYDVSSLYHAKEHIEEAEIEHNIQKRQTELVRDQTKLAVNAAYIKYQEAKKEYITQQQSRVLADDNYRIVEKKYLNQLALLTDMLDASSAKLTAELNLSNSGVNILYRWYQLQKATGSL